MSLSSYQDVVVLGFGRMFIIELDDSQYMNGDTNMFWGMKLNYSFLYVCRRCVVFEKEEDSLTIFRTLEGQQEKNVRLLLITLPLVTCFLSTMAYTLKERE
jgi:hypothetical protein